MQGDQFYCLSASVSHISCQLAAVEPPNHCWLRSDPVWVAAIPPIGRIISVCRSHLACAWLYIAVSGSLLLLLSFLLAILCLRACDRRTKAKTRAADEVRPDKMLTFGDQQCTNMYKYIVLLFFHI